MLVLFYTPVHVHANNALVCSVDVILHMSLDCQFRCALSIVFTTLN